MRLTLEVQLNSRVISWKQPKQKYRYKGKNGLSLTIKQRSGALYTSYLPYTLAALSTLDALSARKSGEKANFS